LAVLPSIRILSAVDSRSDETWKGSRGKRCICFRECGIIVERSTPLRLASRMILPRFERRVFLSLLLLPFDSAAKTIAVICPGSYATEKRSRSSSIAVDDAAIYPTWKSQQDICKQERCRSKNILTVVRSVWSRRTCIGRMKLGQDRFSFCRRPTRVQKVVTTPYLDRSPTRYTARSSRGISNLCYD
jgi:hypothetical protein